MSKLFSRKNLPYILSSQCIILFLCMFEAIYYLAIWMKSDHMLSDTSQEFSLQKKNEINGLFFPLWTVDQIIACYAKFLDWQSLFWLHEMTLIWLNYYFLGCNRGQKYYCFFTMTLTLLADHEPVILTLFCQSFFVQLLLFFKKTLHIFSSMAI